MSSVHSYVDQLSACCYAVCLRALTSRTRLSLNVRYDLRVDLFYGLTRCTAIAVVARFPDDEDEEALQAYRYPVDARFCRFGEMYCLL